MKFQRWPTWLWLLSFVALAAVLRLVTVGRESLWFDEAVSYLAAMLPVSSILNNAVQSSHPPLYYLLLHLWMQWVPNTDLAARLLGLSYNLFLIPVIYLLACELGNERRAALGAALMVAVSPFHILYSHELRMYTQLMLLVSVGTLAYLRARRTGRWYWWLSFVFAWAAAIYTHLFAWLALVAIVLYALLHWRERRALGLTLLAGGGLVVSFAPWARIVIAESYKELGSMRPLSQASHANPIKSLSSLVFLAFGPSNELLYSGLALFLTLSVAAILVVEAWKVRKEGMAAGLLLPILMVVCVVGMPVLFYSIRPLFLPERTMAAASPFLLILFAWGITQRQGPLPYLVYAAVIVMAAGSLSYLTGERIKPPYRHAMQVVARHREDGDAVLHTSDGSYLPALCYVDLPRHALLAGDPDPRKPRIVYEQLGGEMWTREEAGAAGRRLWLIVALEHSWDWQAEQAGHFAGRYQVLERYNVGGIEIYLYDLMSGRGTQ
jgi:mannosyltransferase